ncbi:MAG TPA: TIGR03435 family protein [Bryobacteraceae bacterium]|nr:TIGR03435 family protein [Bryobacteraceae bacterium]
MSWYGYTCTVAAASTLVLAAGLAFGQAPTAAAPAFEVASVKPNSLSRTGGEGSRRENIEATPGSLIMRNVRMSSCVRWAYDVQDYQVTGPGWLNDERYDIAAKAAGGAPEDQLRLMLQGLLAERFKMEVHKESKVLSVYAVVVAKGGPKLHPSEGDEPSSMKRAGMMGGVLKNATLAQACELLSGPFNELLHTPVIDMTGLKGKYDFTVDLAPYITDDMMKRQPGVAPVIPDIVGIAQAALQEQLGLKLEARKAPVDIVVVDRAEKVPTEN